MSSIKASLQYLSSWDIEAELTNAVQNIFILAYWKLKHIQLARIRSQCKRLTIKIESSNVIAVLYHSVLYYLVLCNKEMYSSVLYNAELYSAELYIAGLYITGLYSLVVSSAVLQN